MVTWPDACLEQGSSRNIDSLVEFAVGELLSAGNNSDLVRRNGSARRVRSPSIRIVRTSSSWARNAVSIAVRIVGTIGSA
jgi:hypothetical protein